MSDLTKNWFFFDGVIRRRPVTAPMLARDVIAVYFDISISSFTRAHTYIYIHRVSRVTTVTIEITKR